MTSAERSNLRQISPQFDRFSALDGKFCARSNGPRVWGGNFRKNKKCRPCHDGSPYKDRLRRMTGDYFLLGRSRLVIVLSDQIGLICRKLDRSADVIRNLDECTVVKLPTRVHGQRYDVIAGRKKVLTAPGIVKVIWCSKSDRQNPLAERGLLNKYLSWWWMKKRRRDCASEEF
ncbi:hypothetical protein CEXT_64441 [Caerostris extrusa]|uniref:Uncharacterized protein n=1 Tax=Caerostris extrusa TaxID=172846 RepID=A0AAV4RVK7_CAEEX|nr:hypothetical protein CEXT_64441 [Caerostris extrusa]